MIDEAGAFDGPCDVLDEIARTLTFTVGLS